MSYLLVKDYITQLQAEYPDLTKVYVKTPADIEPVPPSGLDCSNINLTMGANDPNVILMKNLLQKINFYRNLPLTSVYDVATSGNVMSAQIAQGNLLVDNVFGTQTCNQWSLLQPNSRKVALYCNNADNMVYVNNINNAGFTDVFYMQGDNTTAELVQAYNNFKASGIMMRVWVMDNGIETETNVTELANNNLPTHLDIENYSSVNGCISHLNNIGNICKSHNVDFSIVTKNDILDSLNAYNLPSYNYMKSAGAKFIDVMSYLGDYGLNYTTLASAAQNCNNEAPGMIGNALESYLSDNDVVAKTQAQIWAEANAVKVYSSCVSFFRDGLLNYGGLSPNVTLINKLTEIAKVSKEHLKEALRIGINKKFDELSLSL